MESHLKALAFFCILASGGAVLAADPTPPVSWPVKEAEALFAPPAPDANTRRILKELASTDFSTRERATKELSDKGFRAFPGVWKAAQGSGDLELQLRVQKGLAATPFDLPPDLPASAAATLKDYIARRDKVVSLPVRTAFTTLELDNNFGADKNAVVIRIGLEQEADPTLHTWWSNAATSYDGTFARWDLLAGHFDEAQQKLLHHATDYAALVALRRGPAFDPDAEIKALPKEGLTDVGRRQLAYQFYRAKGDQARAATEGARQRDPNWDPLNPGFIESRQYAELAKTALPKVPSRTSIDIALTAELAGDPGRAQDIIDDAMKNPKALKGDVFMGLLNIGRPEEALLAVAKDPQFARMAFSIRCEQLRMREAMQLPLDRRQMHLEITSALIAKGLTAAARDLLKDIKPDMNNGEGVCVLAGQLERVGEAKLATDLRSRIFKIIELHDRQRQNAIDEYNKAQAEFRAIPADTADPAKRIRRDELQKQLPTLSGQMSKLNTGSSLRVRLDNDPAFDGMDLLEVYTCFNALHADLARPLQTCYDMTKDIVTGKISGEILKSKAFLDSSRGQTRDELMVPANILFRTHQDALAEAMIKEVAERDRDPSDWAIAGDWALERNENEKAAKWYRQAAVLNLTDASLMYRLGLALSRQPATHNEGEKMVAFVPYLVLGNLDQANRVADAMVRFEGKAKARVWIDSFIDRFNMPSRDGFSLHLGRESKAAEDRGDYAEALALRTEALIAPLAPFNIDLGGPDWAFFMRNAAAYQRARALDALARKDFGVVAEALEKVLDDGPPDVDLLEKTIPALKAARPQDADKILASNAARLAPIVEDYPEAAGYKEQLGRVKALQK